MNAAMLQYIMHAFWHGFSAGTIALCTAAAAVVTSQHRMPVDWEWLTIAAGAFIAFMNGISSFAQDPNK